MNQIRVGACVPGNRFMTWAPAFIRDGFESLEVNFHMTLSDVDMPKLAADIRALLADTDVKIAAVGYYCNPIENEEQRKTLNYVIDLAKDFGSPVVSTFAGALEGKGVEDAMPGFKRVFGELTKRAEDAGVKLAIENCPMDGTWKKCTCNIGFCPDAWDRMFDAVPSDALGLEWEPAHQMAMLIDPVENLRKYVGKVVHMHGKDANVLHDVIRRRGFGGAQNTVVSRTPGFGDTDWRQIFHILQLAGYAGSIEIEGYHDPLYKGDWEYTGQLHALKYLKWCRGGDFAPNPWNA